MAKELTEKTKLKISQTKDLMRGIMVNTLDGKRSLFELCEVVGVSSRVEYFNMVERPTPKKERTLVNLTRVKKVIVNRGFNFNDGFKIKNVDRKFYVLYKEKPLISIRDRI